MNIINTSDYTNISAVKLLWQRTTELCLYRMVENHPHCVSFKPTNVFWIGLMSHLSLA